MKTSKQNNLVITTNGEFFSYTIFDNKGKIICNLSECVDIFRGISLFKILIKYNIKDVYFFHSENDEFIPMITYLTSYLVKKTNVYLLYMEKNEEQVFCEMVNLNNSVAFEMNCPNEIYGKNLTKVAYKIYGKDLLKRNEMAFAIAMLISTVIGKFYAPKLENNEILPYVEKHAVVLDFHMCDNLDETVKEATKDIFFANYVVIHIYKDLKNSKSCTKA